MQVRAPETGWRGERVGLGQAMGYGLAAGIVFVLFEVVGAVTVLGLPADHPFRLFASVSMGAVALHPEVAPAGTIVPVGLLVHLALSALFGMVYLAPQAALSQAGRRSLLVQALMGTAYGGVLWAVNFHLLARPLFPWLLEAPQLYQALLHALCFGLPLGLLMAASEAQIARAEERQEARRRESQREVRT